MGAGAGHGGGRNPGVAAEPEGRRAVAEGAHRSWVAAAHTEAVGLDLTVANISAKVLVELAGDLVETLRPDGTLIASGVLEERGDEVRDAMLAAGFVELETQQTEDWLALCFRRG